MKSFTYVILFLFFASLSTVLSAQAPEGVNYQAVARDGSGNLLSNQSLAVDFSIRQTSATGVDVYAESHNVTTNDYGLFTAVIGKGTPISGSFSGIDWANDEYFLKVDLDDGSGSVNIGITQLISVPYSLFSQTSGKAVQMNLSDLNDVNVPSPGTGQVLKWDGGEWVPANDNTSSGGTTVNTTPRITGDGSLANPLDLADQGANNNEVLKFDGTNWVPALDSVEDADADPGNELQNLNISGSMLSLTNGNTVTLPPPPAYTAGSGISIASNIVTNTGDTDPSNDITNTTSASGDLSGTYPGPTVTGLQGRGLAATAPANGEVLKWNGSTWAPASDVGGGAGDNWGSQVVQTDATLSGNGVSGNALGLAQQSASNGQVLKWNGSAWAPASDNAGGAGQWSTSGNDIFNNNSGGVGIGTSSPDGKVEISHNSSLSSPHVHAHEEGNDYARLNFDNNNGSNYWTVAAYIASNNRNDRFNIWNGTSGDILSITGDGRMGLNVGISPKTTFHIGNGHRVLFGIDTLGNGDKLMFLPDLHAFRVGTVATGAASTYWNRDSIGLYSFASGLNTRAQGFGATAMGRDTEATNSYAFATGFFSNADGQYSTAMGFNTDAFALGSTALGYSTDAEANYSFAAGYFAEAQAIYSVAIGNAVRAQSYASMAVGRYNIGGGSATSWLTSDPIFEVGIGTGPSTRANAMTIRKNGNVGIGTTVPLDALHVNGRVRLQTVEYIEDGGTSEIAVRGDLRPSSNNIYDIGTSAFRWDDVYATNGTINTSDLRDKENIENLDYGIEEIMQLRPVRYTWKDKPEQGPKLGLIAQELLPVLNEVVKTHDLAVDESEEEVTTLVELDRLGVYYSDIIPVLIKGMQDQQQMLDQQQKQIDELKALVEKLTQE